MNATLGCELKLSHATSDRREEKAHRIEAVLVTGVGSLASKNVLEIGTGAGIIAAHFARAARSFISVDVVDERVIGGFDFCVVGSEELPSAPESFDVVLSNHVIEHVDDQLTHLREIRRVLRPGGVCYLATPNRFGIMEPHFKLPFLSWLPARLRTTYVRLARRGARYDVRPLTYRQLRKLAASAGLNVEDISEHVAADALQRRIGFPLRTIVKQLHTVYPSFVVLLTRRACAR